MESVSTKSEGQQKAVILCVKCDLIQRGFVAIVLLQLIETCGWLTDS